MSVHPQGKPCSDLGRVLVFNDHPAWHCPMDHYLHTELDVRADANGTAAPMRATPVVGPIRILLATSPNKLVTLVFVRRLLWPGGYCSPRHPRTLNSRLLSCMASYDVASNNRQALASFSTFVHLLDPSCL
jgi:hypothetical protein